MNASLYLIQAISQNIALFCCALYSGAAVYISLVETPSIETTGRQFIGVYVLAAQPRPLLFQSTFGFVGSLAGCLAGLTGAGAGWLAGGIIVLLSTLFHLFFIVPETRSILARATSGDPEQIEAISLARIASLYAVASMSGLAALFLFILKV